MGVGGVVATPKSRDNSACDAMKHHGDASSLMHTKLSKSITLSAPAPPLLLVMLMLMIIFAGAGNVCGAPGGSSHAEAVPVPGG